MATHRLTRVWLGNTELDVAAASLTTEKRGPLASWSVEVSLAGFPAADILNLGDVTFRGETSSGSTVGGHALVRNVRVSSAPVMSLLGSGPINGLE